MGKSFLWWSGGHAAADRRGHTPRNRPDDEKMIVEFWLLSTI
jgi:hypothetical protein